MFFFRVLFLFLDQPTFFSVGVLVLEEEDEKGLDLGGFGIYITVIAWIMVGIGALYFLLVSLLFGGQTRNVSVKSCAILPLRCW